MRASTRFLAFILLLLATLAGHRLDAATVAQMNLEQMVTNAERIFVGTVVDITEGRVEAGGGELPAVTYRFRVSDTYKGSYETIKGERFTDVTMVGTLKNIADGRHPIADFPMMQTGGEYLLFVAPAGPLGLTSTMGLAQGCFSMTGSAGSKVVLNGANNTGLFAGMNVGIASGKAVSYDELSTLIRDILGGAQS